MSRHLYKTDEIKSYINNLYDKGARGNSNAYKGISVRDEEHLTSLLIQATPFIDLPSIHDLDPHQGMYLMISKYINSGHAESAIELAEYLKNLFVDYFQDTITKMMEEKGHDDRLHETEQQKQETERQRYSYEKDRI